jgi:hypothetical protein
LICPDCGVAVIDELPRPPGAGRRRWVRRGLVVLAVGCLVLAYVFLRVYPYDQWRFHSVLQWRVEPTHATQSLAHDSSSPVFRVPPHVTTRVSWRADSQLVEPPATVDAGATPEATIPEFLFIGPAGRRTVGSLPQGYIFSAGPFWRLDLAGGSSGDWFWFEPDDTFSRAQGALGTYRFVVTPYADSQPPITFTVSQPRGLLLSRPIEEYVLVAGIAALVVWFALRGRRRSGA